jgi:hypothetical protein
MRELLERIESGNSLSAFLSRFSKKYPPLGRMLRKIKVLEKGYGGDSGHPEASLRLREIHVFPKFWRHDDGVRDFIMAHEIGHWVLGEYGYAKYLRLAADYGVDPWDTLSLPFGQHNGEEAFADSFASYYVDGDVKRRYPEWASIVKAVVRGDRPKG